MSTHRYTSHTDLERMMKKLQLENKQLKKVLKSINALSQPYVPRKVRRHEAFDFFDLPTELRDEILEYCVVVGDVIIRPPDAIKLEEMRSPDDDYYGLSLQHAQTPQAETQLFCVSKGMRDQAAKIYFSRNTFIILPTPNQYSPLKWMPCGDNQDLLQHVRRISIALDYRALSDYWKAKRKRLYAAHSVRSLPEAERSTVRRRLNTVMYREGHKAAVSATHHHWRSMLFDITENLVNLEDLEINVQNAYCPDRFHRLAADIFRVHVAGYTTADMLAAHPVQQIKILGTLDVTERHAIRTLLDTKEVKFYGEQYGPPSKAMLREYPNREWWCDDGTQIVEDAGAEVDKDEVVNRRLDCRVCYDNMPDP
nr:hypothetical protein B0A51_07522 [Rachicladosporium sp. CCFEE 5018]